MEVVRDALGTHSSMCVESVATADQHVNILLKHPIGQQSLSKEFRF